MTAVMAGVRILEVAEHTFVPAASAKKSIGLDLATDDGLEVLRKLAATCDVFLTNTLEAVEDPQTVANGYIVESANAAGTPFKLAAAPIQFGDDLPSTNRAPEFNEHGDAILESIGLDPDAIINLEVRGVVA